MEDPTKSIAEELWNLSKDFANFFPEEEGLTETFLKVILEMAKSILVRKNEIRNFLLLSPIIRENDLVLFMCRTQLFPKTIVAKYITKESLKRSTGSQKLSEKEATKVLNLNSNASIADVIESDKLEVAQIITPQNFVPPDNTVLDAEILPADDSEAQLEIPDSSLPFDIGDNCSKLQLSQGIETTKIPSVEPRQSIYSSEDEDNSYTREQTKALEKRAKPQVVKKGFASAVKSQPLQRGKRENGLTDIIQMKLNLKTKLKPNAGKDVLRSSTDLKRKLKQRGQPMRVRPAQQVCTQIMASKNGSSEPCKEDLKLVTVDNFVTPKIQKSKVKSKAAKKSGTSKAAKSKAAKKSGTSKVAKQGPSQIDVSAVRSNSSGAKETNLPHNEPPKKKPRLISDNKAFKCSSCENTYKTKYSLKVHFDSKHGDKSNIRHNCSSCSKSYGDAQALKDHIQRCHPSTDSKVFQCPNCPYVTKNRNSYNLHYSRKGCYYCARCDTRFTGQVGVDCHNKKECIRCD